MTDIFISYSRKDKAMVSKLAAALEAQGYEVWWDHSLHGGQSFAREIHKQIDQAKCAIVVWSQASVESDWVYSEASHASNRGILLTTVYQDASIPLPYNTRHNEDLRGWNGEANTAQFQKLLSAVEKYCPISSGQTVPDDTVVDDQLAPHANLKPRKINYLAVVLGILGVGAGGFLMQKSDDPAFWSGLVGKEKSQFELPKAEVPEQMDKSVVAAPVVLERNKSKRYALEVSVYPKDVDVTVTVDGKPFDPNALWLPGRYQIEARAEGYKPASYSAVLRELDLHVGLSLELIRLPYEPEMVKIPAGTFTMGCIEGRYDSVSASCFDDETPTREITISKGFSIGKYEVTFEEWDACADDGFCPKTDDAGWGRGKRPVINVSWDDAQVYIAWLNKKTGKKYRLPTEAEWEYAARANSGTAFPWGNRISCWNANYTHVCKQKTVDVGSYSANAFGLYDTVGNVWEWAEDKHGQYGFSVVRGGSWGSNGGYVRSASRDLRASDNRDRYIGFRLALDH